MFGAMYAPFDQLTLTLTLPSPMQIGSGSYSVIPGLTYTGKTERGSWGVQALSTIYLYTNDHHYRVGNRLKGTAWPQRKWLSWLSTSARVKGSSGSLSVGDIAIFGGATTRLRTMLDTAIRSATAAMENSLYVESTRAFLRTESRIRSATARFERPPRGALSIEDVTFTYPGCAVPVLHNLSLELVPGETLAIVGENGAGKSTLVKLVARLYDPDGGRILLDGISLPQLRLDSLHAAIAYLGSDFGRYRLSGLRVCLYRSRCSMVMFLLNLVSWPRYHHRFSLSFRDTEDLLAQRGVAVTLRDNSAEVSELWTAVRAGAAATAGPDRRDLVSGRDSWSSFRAGNNRGGVDGNGGVLDILLQSRLDHGPWRREE